MYLTHKPLLNSDLLNCPETLDQQHYQDFLMWAYGDPCNDANKGIFAEWIVTQLLGIPSERRLSWANSDIITSEGIRIEVKASSYWQDWKLYREDGSIDDYEKWAIQPDSKIRFSSLIASDSTADEKRESKKDYKSDIYIFCFQKEQDPKKWNALDLDQWDYYLMGIDELRAHRAASISLKKLKEIGSGPVSASDLLTRFNQYRIEHA